MQRIIVRQQSIKCSDFILVLFYYIYYSSRVGILHDRKCFQGLLDRKLDINDINLIQLLDRGVQWTNIKT